MIADCETCTRRAVPCSGCEVSQRAICFICQGDVADPYGETTIGKGDTLHDRMLHAFGEKQISQSFSNMLTHDRRNLLDFLTDAARKELILRCIVSHKLRRRFAAQSRQHYRQTTAAAKVANPSPVGA